MRQSVRSRTATRAVAGVLTVLFAVGCSASVGSKVVKKDEVEKQASTALGKKVGRDPDSVTCEDDLKAKAGETVRCTVTVDGKKLGMTATAKTVDGDNVHMDFKVDDDAGAGSTADPAPSDSAQPTESASTGTGTGGGEQSVDKAEVARQGKAALTAQAGKAPDAFSCPENLPARVNATVRCQLASDGKQYGVTVTATSVLNGQVKMNFKVDDTPNG
ncbi:DUF4333 domain-containing protein [Streptomyces sp. NPDC058382]|uniref:DUF4333 domain-containing protein n=1 Tax=unclassified Streptomyces TaxID=2593676 RepID=UPI00362957B7